MSESKGTQSVVKALNLLTAFTKEKHSWGVRELAVYMDMQPSTVYRLLLPFAEQNFLVQDAQTKQYSLGPKFLHYAHIVEENLDLANLAEPFVKELVREVQVTAHLAVFEEDRIYYRLVVESEQDIRVTARADENKNFHTTATGKVMLCSMPGEELDAYMDYNNFRKTPYTITDKEALREDIQKSREQDFAMTWEEHYLGLASIAVPVRNHWGEIIGALSLYGTTVQMPKEKIMDLVSKLRCTVHRIQQELGLD